MAPHAEVEATQTIARQAVATALQDNSLRSVIIHNTLNDRFKDGFVCHIVDTIAKREVDRIVLTRADTNISKLASAREVLAIFVEGDGHDSIGSVESFFDSIAMVDINVDVEDALLESKELNNAEDDVYYMSDTSQARRAWIRLTINIAKTTCLALLGVVKTSSPVDGDVAFATVQTCSSLHATTRADAAELKESVEDRAVITNIVFSLLLGERVHVVWGDLLKEINVFVGMELGHLVTCSRFSALQTYQ